MEIIKCGKCKKYKDISEFNWRNKSKNTRDRWCKECRKAYDKETRRSRYEANRLRDLARVKNRKYGGNVTDVQLQACLDFFGGKDAYMGTDLEKDNMVFSYIIRSGHGQNVIWNIVPCNRTSIIARKNMDYDTWAKNLNPEQIHKIDSWIAYAKSRFGK